MSAKTPRTETEHTVVLSPTIIDAIAEELAARDEPTVAAARDAAFDRVERHTEFVTEGGEALADALEARLSSNWATNLSRHPSGRGSFCGHIE